MALEASFQMKGEKVKPEEVVTAAVTVAPAAARSEEGLMGWCSEVRTETAGLNLKVLMMAVMRLKC